MPYYQLIMMLTGMVITALNPNIVRLRIPTGSVEPGSLWEIIGTEKTGTFYICNAEYGTCMGTFHPVDLQEVIVLEDRSLAKGDQLLWYYNNTDFKLVSVENPKLALDTYYGSRSLQNGFISYFKNENVTTFNEDQQVDLVAH